MKVEKPDSKRTGFLLFVFLILTSQNIYSQNHTLNIKVLDSVLLPVSNATIKINQKERLADTAGMITTILPRGRCRIVVSAVGHSNATKLFLLSNDTSVVVYLRARESLLQHVIVTGSRNILRNQMSVHSLEMVQIQKLPVVLGEVDPMKIITLLPGIKNGGEASAGIYVRGGGPDQNLVLLDGIPVYNPNHLLGFFSVFNGDAVKNIEVIKGGMPAEYGGRLSSVISVNTRDGNKDSIKFGGGIGLISSRLSLEGPLIKRRASFIINARRTYIDQVARLIVPDSIGSNGYYFYDINAKTDFVINNKNALYLTFYTGKDKFTFFDDDANGPRREFDAIWGNTIVGLTWKQQFRKWRHELSFVRNDFTLNSKVAFSSNGFIFSSGLIDHTVKDDWAYTPANWIRWKGGLQYTWHKFRPGAGSANAGFQEFEAQIKDQYAREAAGYLSADVDIITRLNLVAGLRYSYFNQVGPTEQVIYGPSGAPTGEIASFKRGQSIARYQYPEPRINLLYKLPQVASLKLSYTRTIQYLHLATTSAATFPSDLWVPASRLIKPGIAEQVAAGFFKNFGNGRYEASIETYYKTMNNQLEFKPGARLLLNQNLEGEMVFGSGKAYGLELFVQKKTGKLNGWIGYTLSRAERTFTEMNEGKPFPYRYDRTHDISVVANYALGKRWEVSTVFVYGTGNALTMPTGRFVYNLGYNVRDQEPIFSNISQYSKINDYRMPAYHRVDIAFTFTPRPRSIRFKSNWVFSLYNVYNRHNPYFIYIDADEDIRSIKGKQVFLFPILPGITWNFKF
ncbi:MULTISPECIES: TonB-dependent receptor plug domain-containing protein [Niastella]|uniref:TonB-dependent receptor plug domain-containing protein n=1 Tax=Niastella soli TaxID=2821487 RepID=A0ABS3YXF3_9BACT|nr:TonB-dependent receptor [Niastella soli]MBO9202105.1 TonB-dependent receptor plug domain-containing protein [Niastella soli]